MARRGHQGGARLDKSVLRRMVQENLPMSTSLGVVRKFPGEDSHFEIIVDPDTGNREIMVDVELIPRSERVLCRLGFGGDQVYKIPRVDQEVAILIPGSRNSLVQDELEMDPIIVATLDAAPAELDNDDVVVISSPRVIVLADSIQLGAGASPLATLADVDTLRDEFNTHGHLYSPGPSAAVATPSPMAALGAASTYGSAPVGTTIVTGV